MAPACSGPSLRPGGARPGRVGPARPGTLRPRTWAGVCRASGVAARGSPAWRSSALSTAVATAGVTVRHERTALAGDAMPARAGSTSGPPVERRPGCSVAHDRPLRIKGLEQPAVSPWPRSMRDGNVDERTPRPRSFHGHTASPWTRASPARSMLRGRNIAAGDVSARGSQRCRPWASTLHHTTQRRPDQHLRPHLLPYAQTLQRRNGPLRHSGDASLVPKSTGAVCNVAATSLRRKRDVGERAATLSSTSKAHAPAMEPSSDPGTEPVLGEGHHRGARRRRPSHAAGDKGRATHPGRAVHRLLPVRSRQRGRLPSLRPHHRRRRRPAVARSHTSGAIWALLPNRSARHDPKRHVSGDDPPAVGPGRELGIAAPHKPGWR